MQSMASASYADDQARSSEGEAGREERGKRAPDRAISALHLNCGDNRWKITAIALARCEVVSAWRSDFRCTSCFSHLGREADCRLWWNQSGAWGSGVSHDTMDFRELRQSAFGIAPFGLGCSGLAPCFESHVLTA